MRLNRSAFFLALIITALSLAGPAQAGFPAPKPGAQLPGPVFRHMSSAAASAKKFRDDSIIVKFKPGATESAKEKLHKRHGAKVAKRFDRLRMQHLKLKKGMTVPQALEAYRADPNVAYSEPDYLVQIQAYPNDPSFGSLWGMPKINAPAAWDIGTGAGSVVVAVIDTGIDYNHADLAANSWANPGEIAGNGNDDDGNGYVDDIHGIDLYNSDSVPLDDNRHGTHVAGTIGAVGNNGAGVAGVNWNVKLMACKAFSSAGYGSMSAIIGCLEYVKYMKDHGVNIVATNNSWGGAGYSQALYDAIAGQPDILFVAAAGNDSTNIDKSVYYPGGYDLPNIITVAATDEYDNLASFSNTGANSVHVSAPGTSIYSTTPGNSYDYLQGTSMATPHVTGLAALLSATGKSIWQAKDLILTGATPVQALAGKTITGARIDAFNAMAACSNRKLLTFEHLPRSVQAGVPITLTALSLDCDHGVGPVLATLPGNVTLNLLDDGAAPDKVAGDGVFSATWTPASSGSFPVTLSSPAGTRTVAVPPISVSPSATVAPPATALDGAVFAGTESPFSMALNVSGGIPPYSWSVVSGTLPPELTLDSATGEIHGPAPSAGVYPVTIRATDSLGISDSGSWTLAINQGIRPGWPKTLVKRSEDYYSITSSPVFADLDGDARQEIIVADLNSLYVFNENSQVAKYDFPSNVTVFSTPAVADLYNDGRKQIIVALGWPSLTAPLYAFDKDLNLLPGFPAGGFATVNGSPGFVGSPVVADFDGNGQNGILLVCAPNNTGDANFEKNVLVLVDAQGAMVPGWPVVAGRYNYQNSQPAVGDLDQDGKKEIVLLGSDGVLHIFHKDGAEVAGWVPVANAVSAWSPVLADFDGDGFLDIAVKQLYQESGTTMQRLSLFGRTGSALPGWPKDAGYNPNLEIIAADLDGDGIAELIASAGGPDWSGMTAYRGDGSTVPNWPLPSAGGWLSINGPPVAGDLTGSGGQDVLYSTFNPWIPGSFLWGYSASGSPLSGYPKNASLQAEVRSAPALGDLDGNGRMDVAVKANDGTLHVWQAEQTVPALNLQWPMFGRDAQHSNALPVAAVAHFSAAPIFGPPPLLVSFTDSSSNAPVSWSWSFGDGATSTQQNPQHTYTAPGSYSVTLTATGPQGSATSTRFALINVQAPLTLATTSLPPATQEFYYSQALSAAGGTPPYTWSLTGGALPAGMLLDSSGIIAGTASSTGSWSFSVRVSDCAGGSAERTLELTVAANTLVISTTSLPSTSVGASYSRGLSASGGTPPYTWSVASGSLPPGLALDPDSGLVSGTPTEAGAFYATIQVTDATAVWASKTFRITVSALTMPASLPWGTSGAYYSQQLTASGGTPPYTWSNTTFTPPNGKLPDGMSLSPDGLLSGVPAAAGSYSLHLVARDSSTPSKSSAATLYLVVTDPYCVTAPVRLSATEPAQYNGFSNAYTLAADNNAIQLRAGTYSGDLVLHRDIRTSLAGGFDCGFSSNEAERSVIVAGRLRVRNGTVKIDKLSFQ